MLAVRFRVGDYGEASMVVALARHLVQNGLAATQVTVLTFYNGQRKRIAAKVRRDEVLGEPNGSGSSRVCTVDGYQGEENDVSCSD